MEDVVQRRPRAWSSIAPPPLRRIVVAVARHPDVWVEAARMAMAASPPGWWRRRPLGAGTPTLIRGGGPSPPTAEPGSSPTWTTWSPSSGWRREQRRQPARRGAGAVTRPASRRRRIDLRSPVLVPHRPGRHGRRDRSRTRCRRAPQLPQCQLLVGRVAEHRDGGDHDGRRRRRPAGRAGPASW